MKKDFILPDIGEGIVECEIVEWLVKEGDLIKEDQPVCDVMTDKATVQIPAVHDGVVTKLYYAKGDIAKVHAPLFEMTVAGAAPVAQDVSAAPQPVVAAGGKVVEDFLLPDIGEGIVECEVVDWLVKEGDLVAEDQPVCDVMTDKATVQIPAKHPGKIVRLYTPKGQIAKVHAPLFAIELDASLASNPHAPSGVPAKAACPLAQASLSAPNNTAAPERVVAANSPAASQAALQAAMPAGHKALASPAVRRLARELSVDIHRVPGTGPKGRVFKDDVRAYASGQTMAVVTPAVQPGTGTVTSTARVSTAGADGTFTMSRVEPIKGIKAAMARQMAESVATIPHFTYCEEIDLTDLIALRASLKDGLAKQGVKLTMMPFFMKAMSLALNEYPILNSQVNADCTALSYIDEHNIGIAVDSKIGLLVPNIKNCQRKSIVEIAADLTRLTEQARDGRVSPADLKGGTITISNIGAIGGTVATPIINKPEVAIVALGKVQLLPRFDAKGNVVARSIMQVSWSGDHRVIDGGTIARFTNLWKKYLEEPSSMLLALR